MLGARGVGRRRKIRALNVLTCSAIRWWQTNVNVTFLVRIDLKGIVDVSSLLCGVGGWGCARDRGKWSRLRGVLGEADVGVSSIRMALSSSCCPT